VLTCLRPRHVHLCYLVFCLRFDVLSKVCGALWYHSYSELSFWTPDLAEVPPGQLDEFTQGRDYSRTEHHYGKMLYSLFSAKHENFPKTRSLPILATLTRTIYQPHTLSDKDLYNTTGLVDYAREMKIRKLVNVHADGYCGTKS
jgi:hypothetical protein